MPTYIGIDPGLRSGSFAAIDHHGGFLVCEDIITKEDRLDARALKDALLRVIPKGDQAEICIELVGVRPGQGIASSGRFMRAAGVIDAVCALVQCPVSYVRPQEWKKHFGLSANKDDAVALAKRLFPEAKDYLKRVKDHGRAEALLIAEFWRQQQGLNPIGEGSK